MRGTPTYRGIQGHEWADWAAKRGIIRGRLINSGLGPEEGKSVIKTQINKRWRTQWKASTKRRDSPFTMSQHQNVKYKTIPKCK